MAELIGASCVTLVSEVSSEGGGYIATRPSSAGQEKSGFCSLCLCFDKGVSEMQTKRQRHYDGKKKPMRTWSLETRSGY